MANTYKNVVITPNRSSNSDDPKIVFSGANTTTNTDITLRMYPTANGTLSFEGSAGQLFSITNDLTGTIYSVNDVSGIPSIAVYANGQVDVARYSGNTFVGTNAHVMTIIGNTWNNATGSGLLVKGYNTVGSGITLQPSNSASYSAGWSLYAGASGAAIGDGAVGLWNHTVQSYSFYLDQSNNAISTGSMRAPIFYDTDNTGYFVNPRSNSTLSGLRLNGVDNQASGDDYILWISKPNNNDWAIGITGQYEYNIMYDGTSSHTYGVQGRAAGSEYWRVGTDYLYHNASIRAPIFYDTANTSYYADPAGTSNFYGLTVGATITGSVSGNAGTVGGLSVHSGTNNEANKIVRTDGNGYILAGWINTPSGDSGSGTRLDHIYCSYDNYIRYLSLTNFKMQMGLSAKSNYQRYVDFSSDSNYWVGSMGGSGYGANETFHGGSGFFDIWSGTNYPSGTSHIHGFNALHYTVNSLGYTGGNAYGWQMAAQYNQDGRFWTRSCSGGSFSGWYEGVRYGYNTGGNIYGSVFYHTNTAYYFNPSATSGTIISTGSSTDTLGYNPSYGIYIGGINSRYIYSGNSSYSGPVFYNGSSAYTIYHTGNMDAPNKSGVSYYQASTWLQFTSSTYGLYWSSPGGAFTDGYAEFYAQNDYTYGTFKIEGRRQGYSGVVMYPANAITFMWDSGGNGGFYNQNWDWPQYFHYGNKCTGFNGSTTSSSYAIYVSGAIYATGNITAYSDVRKKENIVTIDGALNKVESMRGVYYNRIEDKRKKKQVGVIAQEMNEILPEVVTYADDVDEYGVQYGNMAGVFIEAIKELSAKVKQLTEEIEVLKGSK